MSESTDGGAIKSSGGATDQANENLTSEENLYHHQKDMFKFKEQAREAQRQLAETQARLKELEMQELEKQGKLSEIVESLKKEKKELETQVKQRDYLYAKTNIEALVKQEAIKNGCKDADAFYSLLGRAVENISFDESYRPSIDEVKAVVSEGMKRFEHIGLFAKSVSIVDGVPSRTVNTSPNVKPMQQMTKDELIALAKSMK